MVEFSNDADHPGAFEQLISTTGRIDGAKKVTEMLEKLVRLACEAKGITMADACSAYPLGILAQAHWPFGPARGLRTRRPRTIP